VEIRYADHESKTKALHFEPNKHNVLISELKILYTAITRARVNVWFFDEDEEARAPMFKYFRQLNLVQGITLENEGKGIATTKDAWRDQGMIYYNKDLWVVAEKCFKFAEDELMVRKSRAQQMNRDALKQRRYSRQTKEMFFAAAIGFLECNMTEEAAVCLQNARERLLLAKLNMTMERVRFTYIITYYNDMMPSLT
jgi:hypothetical protein